MKYSYLPLVQQLDKKHPIYALDDGVMTSGKIFQFESIDQVARTCLPFVREIAKKHNTSVVTLAGWSYGGVVASAVAKILSERRDDDGDEDSVRVNSLVLFDAPLRAPPKKSAESTAGVSTTAPIIDVASAGVAGSEASEGDDNSVGRGSSFDLQARTQSHFRSCTDLLQLYYRDQQLDGNNNAVSAGSNQLKVPSSLPAPPLRCAVCDVRPELTDYDCGMEAASELTSGVASRITVPGTHWTMLLQDNVISVGKAIKEFLL